MQNFKKSDYALNKNNESIVYDFADGPGELTLEDFLAENPNMTDADYKYWKAFSDDYYLTQWRDEYKQTWKDVPMDTIKEELESTVSSPDEVIIDMPEEIREEAKREEFGKSIWEKLTKNQQRRFRLYYVDGLTVRQIADREGVSHQSVVECLAGAKKKIHKFLKKF